MKRRSFISKSFGGAMALMTPGPIKAVGEYLDSDISAARISLAQWSLHRSFEKGVLNAADFAWIARDTYQIPAVEYVSSLYSEYASDEKFWSRMKSRADDSDVVNLLIMVDDEGDLGDPLEENRSQAVQNHIKWL
ncbi:MAG: sugar phosphate isomerase/epimerase, partial [Flavobacteriaceae bacterium]